MTLPDDAHELIAEQRLHAHLRPGFAEHADLEVDEALPQRPHVLVGLGRETQSHARRRIRLAADQQARPEGFHEAVVGADV